MWHDKNEDNLANKISTVIILIKQVCGFNLLEWKNLWLPTLQKYVEYCRLIIKEK